MEKEGAGGFSFATPLPTLQSVDIALPALTTSMLVATKPEHFQMSARGTAGTKQECAFRMGELKLRIRTIIIRIASVAALTE